MGGWPHLAFAQSFLDHMTRAACMAGCDVFHVGTGVANRVKVIRLAGTGFCTARKQAWLCLDTRQREGKCVWLGSLLSGPSLQPGSYSESSGQRFQLQLFPEGETLKFGGLSNRGSEKSGPESAAHPSNPGFHMSKSSGQYPCAWMEHNRNSSQK